MFLCFRTPCYSSLSKFPRRTGLELIWHSSFFVWPWHGWSESTSPPGMLYGASVAVAARDPLVLLLLNPKLSLWPGIRRRGGVPSRGFWSRVGRNNCLDTPSVVACPPSIFCFIGEARWRICTLTAPNTSRLHLLKLTACLLGTAFDRLI